MRIPDGQEIVKRLRLPVRDNRPVQRLTQVETLKPGGPGLVLSPTLFQDLQPDSAALLVTIALPEERQRIVDHTLLKRVGSAIDIARTVRFLMFDAPYITGQIIAVDGGRSAHL